LHLVAYQLELFNHRPSPGAHNGQMQTEGDAERDRRTGAQWLRAILGYLEFRMGNSWRRLSDPAQRWAPERTYYLEGYWAVSCVYHRADDQGRVSLPSKKQPQSVRRASTGRRRQDRVA
jgi:hypothetical protein